MTAAACASEDGPATHEMLRRLRDGDQSAFNVLFQRHSEPLTRFVARMVETRHVAAELVQDVFLRVWSGRAVLDIRGDFHSYLRRAARNRALDWLRREGLHREWEQTAVHETQTVGDVHASDQDRMARMSEALAQTLAAMPERRREVCQLRWREGLGPSAIAERLGVSVKTVESHITLGLKAVRASVFRD